MNKGSKIAMWVLLAGAGLGLVSLAIRNALFNENFLEASLTTCISIAVAIGISYLLVQRQADKRKQKDILLDLISAVQAIIEEKEAYTILATTDPDSLTMRNRDINNRLSILKKYSKRFGITEEIDFVMEKFSEYRETIDDHIDKLDMLCDLKKQLKRPLELIGNKLVEIMLKIYT